MSNKAQLQVNNSELDNYIARINAAKEVAASLPDVGSGGGSVETWTGTLYGASGLGDLPNKIYSYTDETSTLQSITVAPGESATIKILANTYIISYILPPTQTNYSTYRLFYYSSSASIILPTKNNFEIS